MLCSEAFARMLAARGVRTVFGVMGDGNMYWVVAFAGLTGTQWHAAWHEAGAVGMADGYAAATGDLGVATVTMGPGLAQSLAALTAAARTRRPVLLVTAEVTGGAGQAQWIDQRAWVETGGARYVRADAPERLAEALDEALAVVRSREPCVLAVQVEIFDAEFPDGLPVQPAAVAASPAGPVPEVGTAVARLSRARSPMVIVGGGAVAGAALEQVRELAERLGAVLLTTVVAKGALEEDPFQLGLAGMLASPLARQVCHEADVAVIVGANLDRYNTDGGGLLPRAHVIRIDRRAPELLWDADPERVSHLTGDAAPLAELLTAALPSARPGLRTEHTLGRIEAEAERQFALRQPTPPDGPNPWEVVSVLDAELPPDGQFVVGIAHFWYFLAPYLSGRARRFQFGTGFGLIGQALPLAAGAAVADRPGLVVAFEGDGSLPMNIVELQSAVRSGRDLLVVTINNSGYGSEYHKLVAAGLPPQHSQFDVPLDIVAAANAFGVLAARASDIHEIAPALRGLLGQSGVRLLDVAIAMTPMSEVYAVQHG